MFGGKVTIHGLGSRNYLGSRELPLSLGSQGNWAPEFNWLHRIPIPEFIRLPRITVLCLVVSSKSERCVFFFFLQIEVQVYNVG